MATSTLQLDWGEMFTREMKTTRNVKVDSTQQWQTNGGKFLNARASQGGWLLVESN